MTGPVDNSRFVGESVLLLRVFRFLAGWGIDGRSLIFVSDFLLAFCLGLATVMALTLVLKRLILLAPAATSMLDIVLFRRGTPWHTVLPPVAPCIMIQ